MRAPRRRIAVGLATAAITVATATGAALRSRGGPAAPVYETAVLERGDVVARVAASGTVAARRTVLVSSQVSGRVKEVHVDFNSPVRRGQLLARIDPQPFEAQVAQSESNAAAARANVEKARANAGEQQRLVSRRRVLAERQLIAAEEWESAQAALAIARAEVAAAEASVAQAKAVLEQARFNLGSTAIRAPIDGIVVARDVDVGQTVAASLQAPTLFTLAEDLRSMEVQAHVSESDVGRIVEGMAATFTVAAFPRNRIAGTVRQVRNAATTKENVVTYDVVVDVENPDLRLKPGMTANVTFTVAERRDVLRVPNAALRFRPPGAAPAGPAVGAQEPRALHVVAGDGLRRVPVQVGVTDGSYTEITEGDLQAGSVVATYAAGGATRTAERQTGGGPPPPRMF